MFILYMYYKLSLKDLQGGIRDFFACFLQILNQKNLDDFISFLQPPIIDCFSGRFNRN